MEFERYLGEGSFGSVSLFSYKRRCDVETLYTAILSKFKGCSRIVQCYGSGVEQRLNDKGYVEYTIPMEYAAGGSLSDFMDRFNDKNCLIR
ncbi:putative protein kinase-like domain superfamily [Arabidopsis thaliana]